jgi:CheY-like chemotaxis protein
MDGTTGVDNPGSGPSARAEPSATPGIAPSAPPHVLVVEDNVTNQFVFAHFLRRIGLPFDMVPNGAEALAAWEAGGYDVVLMDIEMPVMDGYETARELRRREAGRHRAPTPIIALTADAMQESRDRARACGMNDFVTKPVELDRLRRSILKALRPEAMPRPEPAAAAGGPLP